jgi:exopolysaccharide biosynthesis operon protein EpsL
MSKLQTVILLNCGLLLAGSALAAPEDAIRPYASYSVTRDSNLFRLQDNPESDVLKRLEAGVDIDLPISRQHLLARANVSNTRFNRFSDLGYDGRDLLGQWNWQLGNLWSGDLGYSNTRTLASFADIQQRLQNVRTQQRAFADASYRLHPDWRVSAGTSRYDLTNSAGSQNYLDRTEDAAELGLQYISPTSSTVGLQLKRIDGNLPNRELISSILYDNSYRQTELNATANWAFSGNSRFTGRLGYTRRKHAQVAERDFSGIAGRLGMNWVMAGKTTVDAAVWREVGAVEGGSSSYVLSSGASLAPSWAATSKLTVQGRISYQKYDYQGDPRFINVQLRKDTVRTLAVGAFYAPWRSTRLGLNFQTDRRDSNTAQADYRANSVTASVRVEF